MSSPSNAHQLCATPALLTGTSSEYLGKRALPKMLRERANVIVLGPSGSGKTSVSLRLAGEERLYLNTRDTHDALVQYVAERGWSDHLLAAPTLVLDGPVWLSSRPAAVHAFRQLMMQRQGVGRRTFVCQGDAEGTVHELIGVMEPGSLVIVGLRFPKGRRGRLRFARRMCDELRIPRVEARGTDQLEPWDYAHVITSLRRRKAILDGAEIASDVVVQSPDYVAQGAPT